ncbi:hypothetical protein EEL51_05255 [Muribaculaceae bacterium Isolate-110 (HZI)]|nr:hypothetical protein EEL51_05255 [Muribaculaceae bacterium Isolate-110 (HZI)]
MRRGGDTLGHRLRDSLRLRLAAATQGGAFTSLARTFHSLVNLLTQKLKRQPACRVKSPSVTVVTLEIIIQGLNH